MVPQYADPRTLNRYVYASNSPVNYTDPSGYCWGSDTWHPSDQNECWRIVRRVEESLGGSANSKLQEMNASWRWKAKWDTPQLRRLLYLIDNYSGKPNLVLGEAFTVNGEERLWLMSAFGQWVSLQNLNGSTTAVDALAQWIEFAVALQRQQGAVNKGVVINDLLLVENGFTKNRWGFPQYAPVAQSLGVRQFNDTGFHPVYRDGDDQVHHVTFFMALGSDAPLGLPVGGLINLYHETIDPNATAGKSLADYRLGVRALQLGAGLALAPVESWGDLVRYMLRTADFTVLYPSPCPVPF